MPNTSPFGAPLKTRQQVVTDRLRDAILKGYLKPGQRLDQSEIAEKLQVSRSPLREALHTLSGEGLVEILPHRGAIVTELSLDELEEILALRAVLEGMAARLAVPKMKDESLKQLESLLGQLDQATDLDQWIKLNNHFHYTIYRIANRPRLLALTENLRNTVMPYMRQFIATSDHMREAASSHRLIFDACVKRDSLLAEQETQNHLAAVTKGVVIYAKSMVGTPAEEFGPVPLPKLNLPFGVS